MKQIDHELIRHLQKDDRSAFDALYWRYKHKIYLNVFRLTKDSNISEDIVQDVFITVWEKRLSIDPSKPIINWMIMVSYHKTIDYLRRSLKIVPVFDCTLPDTHLSEHEDTRLRENKWNLIEKAVEELSPQQRRVFELCKLQGKTYKCTAQELHISIYTVKEYLSTAMKYVREFTRVSGLSLSGSD